MFPKLPTLVDDGSPKDRRCQNWGQRPQKDPKSGSLFTEGAGWGPPVMVISWFINQEIIPMNTIVISTINHSFSATYKPTERYLGGPILCDLTLFWYDYLLAFLALLGKMIRENHNHP